MTSTIITPTAQTVADFITEITGLDVVVTGYLWERQAFDAKLPVGTVGIPTIRRTAGDEQESQMGMDDWHLEIPVGLYFDLSEIVKAQDQAVEVVEAFIRAVDENPSLNDPTIVNDASVVEATPEVLIEQRKSLLAYRCRLELTKLAPSAY